MTDIRPRNLCATDSPPPFTVPAEDEGDRDLEDHLIDLHGALSALAHLSSFDGPAGLYLIARIHEHAEGVRRAFYQGRSAAA